MRRIALILVRITLGTLLFVMGYSVLLNFPRPLFPYAVQAHGLVLHSDGEFQPGAAADVLQRAEHKLARSPLYDPGRRFDVFVCNAPWRRMLFFSHDYGAGGVAPYPLTPHVFLRDARIEDNRLNNSAGQPVPGDRTLDYFVAHEVTHQLTGSALGPVAYARLPVWVREGYADYVGKGDFFRYEEARRALLAGAPEMNWHKIGLYAQFHLLVAHVLERQHVPLMQLLQHPPALESVESALQAGRE